MNTAGAGPANQRGLGDSSSGVEGPLAVPDLDDGFVRLRPPTYDDVDAMTAACQLPDVTAGTTVPFPYERSMAETFVEAHVAHAWGQPAGRAPGEGAHADLLRQGVLAVTIPTRFGDRWLANVGLHDIDHELGQAEVGYLAGLEGRGAGAVTRSVLLMTRWAIRDLGLRRIYWQAVEGNEPSLAVARRAGFTLEGTLRLGLAQRGVLVNGWTASVLATDLAELEPIAEIAAGPWHLLPTQRPAAARCAWTVHRSVGGDVVGRIRVYDGRDGGVVVAADESISAVGADDTVETVRRYVTAAHGWVLVDPPATH